VHVESSFIHCHVRGDLAAILKSTVWPRFGIEDSFRPEVTEHRQSLAFRSRLSPTYQTKELVCTKAFVCTKAEKGTYGLPPACLGGWLHAHAQRRAATEPRVLGATSTAPPRPTSTAPPRPRLRAQVPRAQSQELDTSSPHPPRIACLPLQQHHSQRQGHTPSETLDYTAAAQYKYVAAMRGRNVCPDGPSRSDSAAAAPGASSCPIQACERGQRNPAYNHVHLRVRQPQGLRASKSAKPPPSPIQAPYKPQPPRRRALPFADFRPLWAALAGSSTRTPPT
jgi:hypothetical protein